MRNDLHFTIRKAQESDIDAITTLHSTITEKFVPTIVPSICQFSDITVTRDNLYHKNDFHPIEQRMVKKF